MSINQKGLKLTSEEKVNIFAMPLRVTGKIG
jgi:hypothetical protein